MESNLNVGFRFRILPASVHQGLEQIRPTRVKLWLVKVQLTCVSYSKAACPNWIKLGLEVPTNAGDSPKKFQPVSFYVGHVIEDGPLS